MAHRVLAVDDDPEISHLVKRFLETKGVEVTLASDGREALRLAEAAPPNVILLDIMMPGMDGQTVLAELRRRPALNATKIVMLTARGADLGAQESKRVGADGYVTKPFTRDELFKAVGV